MATSVPVPAQQLDREIEIIERALEDQGPVPRDRLAELVGARFWGPGVFGRALREAVVSGEVARVSRRGYALPKSGGGSAQNR